MSPRQRIIPERRRYNQWVASETLEDYALRYTASHARKSAFRVGNTAFGPIAFLACEAIGGAITFAYGFHNTAIAIGIFAVLMFLIGLPISVYGARHGVDIDLLTRGAGFGYIGSTITSLIYASFTFLLFAIEASIMSVALQMLFGIPLAFGHLISALLVIPIALYGISLISRVQVWTQPIWLFLQVVPLGYIIWKHPHDVEGWMAFAGRDGTSGPNWLMVGAAASVLLSLLPQIGEQVDYLRFMPIKQANNRVKWWATVIGTGPGWVLLGGLKLLAGSFLAYVLLSKGFPADRAEDPTSMYHMVFTDTFGSSTVALIAAGVFVIVCQFKINVTNAYAGSIAWSNFFSRVTHSHPGRVVWLVFNVLLALLLMEIGVFRTIESVLAIYANFAAGWIGAITADLVINKSLGWSPRGLEFKRAHLYDINPVGVGALALSVAASSLAYVGLLGELPRVLSPFVALLVSFIAAPLIAAGTRGRYYIARQPAHGIAEGTRGVCTVCENQFESADMALCPAYGGAICSLCCSLDARCHDQCKPRARLSQQVHDLLTWLLPARAARFIDTTAGRFFSLLALVNITVGMLLYLIHAQIVPGAPAAAGAVDDTLWMVFFSFLLLSGIVTWVVVLAHDSRRAAESESARQTSMLMEEIEAHKKTDLALQQAKEVAEAANLAKSRYIVGLGHEIRTPLNSIYGYAQLLERSTGAPAGNAVRVIRRSAEHLTSLVDGLLDISRIEGGVLRLARDKVHLSELLDQLEDMFRLQAQNKGIEFRCERAAHLPAFVHTDQKRLRQILINLLSNAVKYTDTGHAAMTVRYRNQVGEFEITDTGMGIPADELQRIFEPFERGHDAARRGIPGTGLGLTITKLLTQVMGGEISVQSEPGRGTTFLVRMFLSEAMHGEASDRRGRITGYVGARRCVLLIDDDSEHVEMMRLLLDSLGFEVLKAAGGRLGLEAIERRRPDIALLDISMPDLTGWEVLTQIRQRASLSELPVVMVSANAHEYTPVGYQTAHDGFLTKPVDVTVLLETLQRCLRLEWRHDPPDAAPKADQLSAGVTAARHHLEDLWQLGKIGHVRGIHAKLRDIESEDPAARPITTHLRGLVESFEMKRYMELVGELRADG
jgi:signal transduction histidine kinase/CheY-like chemotaxis protein